MGGSATPTPTSDDRSTCPDVVPTTITGPAGGIAPNSWLDVQLQPGAPGAVFVNPVTGTVVGSLAGVSGLARLIRCMREGVAYRAYVDSVSGGRVEVTITRQG